VLPVFKKQEDWEGGANEWRGSGGPIHVRRPKDPHPTAPAFIDAAREMGMPILDDVNGPMVPGAGYINMNIAADGTRVSAARAFLHPARPRPNLTLLLNTPVVKLNFTGTRCVGAKIMTGGDERRKTVVYVHPNPSPDAVAHSLGLPDNLLDFPTDTNRAIAQMHYTNRFARTPNVKVHLLARRRVDSLLGRALRDHRRDGIHRGRRAARLRG
jgi:hypothetical protein